MQTITFQHSVMANYLEAVQTAAQKLSQVLDSAKKENSDQLVT